MGLRLITGCLLAAVLTATAATAITTAARAGDAGANNLAIAVDATAPFELPANWIALPALAAPAHAELADTAGVSGTARAWGDPSLGVFALLQQVESTRPLTEPDNQLPALHAQLRTVLEQRGATIEQWSTTTVQGAYMSSVRYTITDVHGAGHSRAEVDTNGIMHATTFTCFYSEREIALAREQCDHLLTTYSP